MSQNSLILGSQLSRLMEHSEFEGNLIYLEELATNAAANKASVNTPNTFQEVQSFNKAVVEKSVNVTSANIDVSLGSLFVTTIVADFTPAVINVSGSGSVSSFILDITNVGAFVINWFSGIKWAGGQVPTITANSRDIYGFYTFDGGSSWVGIVLAKDVK